MAAAGKTGLSELDSVFTFKKEHKNSNEGFVLFAEQASFSLFCFARDWLRPELATLLASGA